MCIRDSYIIVIILILKQLFFGKFSCISICYFNVQKISDHRRKWDRDEYERLAAERIQEELDAQEKAQQKQPIVKRELLKQRDYRVDLESKLGKSIVITKNTPSSQTGGYVPYFL